MSGPTLPRRVVKTVPLSRLRSLAEFTPHWSLRPVRSLTGPTNMICQAGICPSGSVNCLPLLIASRACRAFLTRRPPHAKPPLPGQLAHESTGLHPGQVALYSCAAGACQSFGHRR